MSPLEHLQTRKRANMTIHAEMLLDLIQSMGEPHVMRAIENGIGLGIATTMTLHKSLMWLKTHGYILIEHDEGDRRSKFCKLTTKGKKYLL
jgi:DNA-binding MarR family transcriptional regulator